MKTIYIPKSGTSSMVMVACPVGSFYEPDNIKGINHFVEHMCFKGTKNRTTKEITSSIDNIGGILNAFTDYEVTAYWAKVGNKYLSIADEIITDLATNPIFPIKEVNKEREVILQELKMYQDIPQEAVVDLFNKTLYAKNSGFYLPIIGTLESLKEIKKHVLDYYHIALYNNLIKIIVGNIESNIPFTQFNLLPYKDFNLINKPNIIFEYRKDITQAHVLLGYHVNLPQYTYIEKYYLLEILSALYSDMSGRLFSSVREKHNLVYGIHFDYDIYRDGSITWYVSLGLDSVKIKKAEKLIKKELTQPIISTDVKRLQEKCIGSIAMRRDNITNIANGILYRIIRGQFFGDMLETDIEKFLYFSQKKINKFIEDMNFNKYSIVGILPKK